ncbi:XdhC family protein [Halobacterium wangiae]|uniref:XdhC family protein n=1 Tax=Halobacterium wangiae TaxID=2902623 RepID=UPI001E4B0399|nr:XdhC/CoxI family protein [Halobacterium wangiae]
MDSDDPWSVTDRDLHDRLRSLRDADATAAVATVVDVEGSAYRRPGAKLLAPDDDDALGAITAGCLEGPVAELAADARQTAASAVETFDLMDDDEWGLGLGCNGIIDVLVEPLDDSYDPLLAALADREPATVLTVVESDDETVPVGARTVVTADGPRTGDDRPGLPADVLNELRDASADARESGSSGAVTVERAAGDLRVFVDGVEPAPDLLLFGAQNDVHAVARFGAEAGFRVTVASARGARASEDAFPHAHRVVGTHPSDVDEVVEAPERTYAVLMSHNLIDDQLVLETLLRETEVPYVGLMGPRERFEEIRDAVAEEGTTFTPGELDRVSTPVGLDLGDGSPTGIALSVVAEALAVANDAAGGRLREQSGPIHPRTDPTP